MDLLAAKKNTLENQIQNAATGLVFSRTPLSNPRTAGNLLASFSLANLCLLPVWYTLVFQQRFYARTVFAVDYVAAMANVALVSLLFWALFALAERVTILRGCRYLPFLVVSVVALTEVRRLYFSHAGGIHIPYFLAAGYIENHWWRGAAAYTALIMLSYLLVRYRRFLLAACFAAALAVSPFAVLLLGQSAWQLFQFPRPPMRARMAPPTASRISAGNRVLWLIFDELDYRAVFEARPPELNLPELDALRAQSVFATQAYPPAPWTIASIPALLSGRRITRSEGSGSILTVTYEKQPTRVIWGEQANVFTEAHARGVRTAMLGWFIPYCRIDHGALDYCVWHPKDGLRETQGLRATMLNQLRALSPLAVRTQHVQVFEQMRQEAISLVRDPSMGLVVIHLPVPHEPGIYDRRANRFTYFAATTDWYLGNVALVDRALGDLRRAMQEAGTWDKTAVIVTSDHYWRTSPSSGSRDQRVPLLLRMPKQDHSLVVTEPLTTVILHDLVPVLEDPQTTPEAVAAWLQRHSGKLPDVLPLTAIAGR